VRPLGQMRGHRAPCPACGSRAPRSEVGHWAQVYGHRCPHGAPCVALSGKAVECGTCRDGMSARFWCERRRIDVTRDGCAALHRSALMGSVCSGCPVGEAHERRETPEVPPPKDFFEPPAKAVPERQPTPPPREAAQREQEAPMAMVKCGECSKEFNRKAGPQKYCSEPCKEAAKAKRPSNGKRYGKVAKRTVPRRRSAVVDLDKHRERAHGAVEVVCGAIEEREAEILEMKRAANRLAEILGVDEPYDLEASA
jgi:hypothetical protein